MQKIFIGLFTISIIFFNIVSAQVKWKNVDSLYAPLPTGMHVYFTNDSLNGAPNIAYYVSADLKNTDLDFTTALGNGKRFTPSEYYTQHQQPIVVVNCTFFEFKYNQNLNIVVKDGLIKAHNLKSIANKKDSSFFYVTRSALGIDKKRNASIVWAYTDSTKKYPYAFERPTQAKGFKSNPNVNEIALQPNGTSIPYKKWEVQTAVGGGPRLLNNGMIEITNNEERMFSGKAIDDKHPRTAIGYTANNTLIIMVIQGRAKGIADGVTLTQEAQLLKDVGCVNAINLDGGGSSCMLVNGKPTITVSDKEGQRPVPAVFMIQQTK